MNNMIDYKYLRPKKAENLLACHNKDIFVKTDISYTIYEHATVLPLVTDKQYGLIWGSGGLVDRFNNYVEDSGIGNFVNNSYDFSSPKFFDNKIVYCGYLRFEWGHLLVDCSSRLYYVLQHYDEIDFFVYFVEMNSKKQLFGNYKEFFQILGILDKLLIVDYPTTFREVVVPKKSYDRFKHICYDEFSYIFDVFNENLHKLYPKSNYALTNNKIFLTRSKLPKAQKQEFGMDMLDDFFCKNGFRVISPEQISLHELILLLDNASEVACVSGTLPHNMIMSNGKARLTIIERYCLNNEIQVDINRIKSLNVTYIDANMCIYPVEISYGPFIFVFNKQLKQYALDNQFLFPSNSFFSDSNKRKLYKKYKDTYKTDHYESIYMPVYMRRHADIICEAYDEAEEYYRDYLFGIKPYRLSQCFTRRILKQFIKRIVIKFAKGK